MSRSTATPVERSSCRDAVKELDVGSEPKPLLDVPGVARRLGVPERFVRRLVDQRRVPFLKIGKYVRFDPDVLDEWIASHEVEPMRTLCG